jgi:hypothetical protein
MPISTDWRSFLDRPSPDGVKSERAESGLSCSRVRRWRGTDRSVCSWAGRPWTGHRSDSCTTRAARAVLPGPVSGGGCGGCGSVYTPYGCMPHGRMRSGPLAYSTRMRMIQPAERAAAGIVPPQSRTCPKRRGGRYRQSQIDVGVQGCVADRGGQAPCSWPCTGARLRPRFGRAPRAHLPCAANCLCTCSPATNRRPCPSPGDRRYPIATFDHGFN